MPFKDCLALLLSLPLEAMLSLSDILRAFVSRLLFSHEPQTLEKAYVGFLLASLVLLTIVIVTSISSSRSSSSSRRKRSSSGSRSSSSSSSSSSRSSSSSSSSSSSRVVRGVVVPVAVVVLISTSNSSITGSGAGFSNSHPQDILTKSAEASNREAKIQNLRTINLSSPNP